MEREKLDLSLSAMEHLIDDCHNALELGNRPDHVAFYLLGCLGILQDDLAFVMRTKKSSRPPSKSSGSP